MKTMATQKPSFSMQCLFSGGAIEKKEEDFMESSCRAYKRSVGAQALESFRNIAKAYLYDRSEVAKGMGQYKPMITGKASACRGIARSHA